ncbi:hypothetical protein ACFQ9V_12350 [Leifsonia sp. NPDC056665]|uniref:hypothetical protein n=1 Tax=Leifsonia sp. NPDC056665 TaxID=3345901 RepID=UPI00368E2584
MRSVGWSLFGFAFVVAAVALGALTTPAVDHGLATVAVGHHLGFTRRQWVDLAIAALFFIAAAAAAGALVVTRIRAAKHITTDATLAPDALAPDVLVPVDR